MKKLLLAFFAIIIFSQCTGLVEGTIRNSLIGTWEATQITDDLTGDITSKDEGDFILTLFGSVLCDAIILEADDDFVTYYETVGLGTGDQTGTWEYAFLDLTLAFDTGDTIVRRVSAVDDFEMTMRDTINGRAKTVIYTKLD